MRLFISSMFVFALVVTASGVTWAKRVEGAGRSIDPMQEFNKKSWLWDFYDGCIGHWDWTTNGLDGKPGVPGYRRRDFLVFFCPA